MSVSTGFVCDVGGWLTATFGGSHSLVAELGGHSELTDEVGSSKHSQDRS